MRTRRARMELSHGRSKRTRTSWSSAPRASPARPRP